jgi:hypothetical protein
MLKRLSFVVAMLAAISLVVSPVAPAYAQAMKSDKARNEVIVSQAKKGNIAILSKAQMTALKVTNPRLHAKLWTAYQKGTLPSLTAGEKKVVAAFTSKNLQKFTAAGSEWVVVALVVAAIIILLWWFGVMRADNSTAVSRLALRRKLVHRRARA